MSSLKNILLVNAGALGVSIIDIKETLQILVLVLSLVLSIIQVIKAKK